jgi:hypothetical protein
MIEMSANTSPQVPVVAAQAFLEVVDGVHSGVTLPLDKSVYSIGSKPGTDIILADEGVAPEHGVIRLHGRTVIVEAVGGDIGLGTRHRVAHGHGCRTTLPVELSLGSAVIRIAQPAESRTPFIGGTALRWSAIGAVACAVLIPMSGYDPVAAISRMSLAAPAAPVSDAAPSRFALTGERTAATDRLSSAADATGTTVDAAAGALGEKLAQAGLAELAARVDGSRVLVSGAILHDQNAAWSDIQRWFDATFGSRYVLASAVGIRPPGGNPKFDLQAIAFSESPYVITADGQRRYPGAVLDKGWVIKEISERRLTLTKNGQELALSF